MAGQIPPLQIPPKSRARQWHVVRSASPAPRLLAEQDRQRLRMIQLSPVEPNRLCRDLPIWILAWQEVQAHCIL